MKTDRKLAAREKELKLMRGEVKQILASARDYLRNMELPPSKITAVQLAPGDDKSQAGKDEVIDVGRSKDTPVNTKSGASGR